MNLVSVIINNQLFLFKVEGEQIDMTEVKDELERLAAGIQSDLNDAGEDDELSASFIVDVFTDKARLEKINLVKVDVDVSVYFDNSGPVFCKYCGEPNGSDDENVLCAECREFFGHSFYSEL